MPGAGGGTGPAVWTVPAVPLTQTFTWGSREDGLLFDKFAFGPVDVCYTVGDLDAARGPSGTCPPLPPPTPPAYTRTGPPLATGQAKFLGSAWSPGNASLNFGAYWNQVTPENGGKWGSAQRIAAADRVFTFDPGVQLRRRPRRTPRTPMATSSSGTCCSGATSSPRGSRPAARTAAGRDPHLAGGHRARVPELDQIDVVNEALHDPPDKTSAGNTTAAGGSGGYKDALGGDGATG